MSTKILSIKPIQTRNLPTKAAIAAFVGLNEEEGKVITRANSGSYPPILKTESNPMTMLCPDGWYFAKKSLRNKHSSTTGMYSEIKLMDNRGGFWDVYALEDDVRSVRGGEFSPSVLADVIKVLNPGSEKVNDVTVKLTNPMELNEILVLEGWNIVVNEETKCITLYSGNKYAYVVT